MQKCLYVLFDFLNTDFGHTFTRFQKGKRPLTLCNDGLSLAHKT